MTLYKAVYFDQQLQIIGLILKCSYSSTFAHAKTFQKKDDRVPEGLKNSCFSNEEILLKTENCMSHQKLSMFPK